MSKEAPSLARLPGQIFDPAAQILRKEIKACPFTGDALFNAGQYKNGDGTVDKDRARNEVFAVASIVIDNLWDFMKKRIPAHPIEWDKIPSSNLELDLGQQFMLEFHNVLREHQNAYQEWAFAQMEEGDSRQFALYTRLFKTMEEHRGLDRHAFSVIMGDLPPLFGHIADVARKAFQRDMGRNPSQKEFTEIMRNSGTRKLFIEIMSNSKSLSLPLLGGIAGKKAPYEGNVDESFNPFYFKVEKQEGSYVVMLDPKLCKTYRDQLEKFERTADPKQLSRTLKCPALYGGKFPEMYEWTCDEFERFCEIRSAPTTAS